MSRKPVILAGHKSILPTFHLSDLNRAHFTRTIAQVARMMAPTLIAFTFANAAHAQGTMDFSGATTLMGTFNRRAMFSR
jgi:hypothetical protein